METKVLSIFKEVNKKPIATVSSIIEPNSLEENIKLNKEKQAKLAEERKKINEQVKKQYKLVKK